MKATACKTSDETLGALPQGGAPRYAGWQGRGEPIPFDDTESRDGGGGRPSRNVLGGALAPCSQAPVTGFFRNGGCDTSPEDIGSHTVCAVMTAGFLAFSRGAGNDLSTPYPAWGFPGLRPGDRWCLCAPRWQEALEAGQAPRVVLAATHEGALRYCRLEDLRRHAVDAGE